MSTEEGSEGGLSRLIQSDGLELITNAEAWRVIRGPSLKGQLGETYYGGEEGETVTGPGLIVELLAVAAHERICGSIVRGRVGFVVGGGHRWSGRDRDHVAERGESAKI